MWKILYYADNDYVVGWFPGPKGELICHPTWEKKENLEEGYQLDQEYYINNN